MNDINDFWKFLIMAAILIVGYIIVIRVNHLAFKHMQKRKKRLHMRFFENAIRVVLLIFMVLFVTAGNEGLSKIYRYLASSTVVLTGVIGLASQEILQDVLAGIVLSLSKPFEIGDRVLLASVAKPCVIEDMTLRHVVLKTMDNIRYIIPNSKINDEIITNTSYHQRLRGTFIQIPIAYSADIRKAMEIVKRVIKQCPYTFPGNPGNEDLDSYGDVYLMSYDNYALNLETTIWTEPSMDNFLACSEIRMEILEAFRKEGIEIPYHYVNVMNPDPNKIMEYTPPVQRDINIKTDEFLVKKMATDMPEVLKLVDQYCTYYNISPNIQPKLELLTEEVLSFMTSLLVKTRFIVWVEGHRGRIHIYVKTEDEFSKRKQMAIIKNSTDLPFAKLFFHNLRVSFQNDIEPSGWLFEMQKQPEASKQLLLAYADEVKIGIIDKRLVTVVTKKLD